MFTYGNMSVDTLEIPEDFPPEYNPRFAALHAQNEDVVAFIDIPGTRVSYPVVQTNDNDFYVHRTFDRQPAAHGIPFMDSRVDLRGDSGNMVIYGHMADNGRLFGDLAYLNTFDGVHGGQRALDFYTDHSIIELTTLFGETVQYRVFAVFFAQADPLDGIALDYHDFIAPQQSGRDFNRFIGDIGAMSLIHTGVDVRTDDMLLTLSLDTPEFEGVRFVVVARMLRPGEDPQVSANLASINNHPIIPDVVLGIDGDEEEPYEEDHGEPEEEAAPAPAQEPQQTQAAAPPPTATTQAAATQPPAPPAQQTPPPAPEPEPEPEPEEDDDDDYDDEIDWGPPSFANNDNDQTNNTNNSGGSSSTYNGELFVIAGVQRITADALEIVSRIVQVEVGPSFHDQAIMAQAVAAYSFVRYSNDQGNHASVILAPRVDPRVERLTAQVLGQAIYFNGRIAFTPYFATSAGRTNASRDVWGGHYPYLISVDSSVDREVASFERRAYFSRNQVIDMLESRAGISPSGDPSRWFETLTYTDGRYIGNMSISGYTTNQRTGARLTGRHLREVIFNFNLRSASFDVFFDSARDQFVFTTFGHGHGVGMSQTGANVFAQRGWTYREILLHYFPGTTVS